MTCPVDVASEMSALAGGEDRFHAERHGKLSEGRSGAGDEVAGSDFTSDGELTSHAASSPPAQPRNLGCDFPRTSKISKLPSTRS